MRSAEPAYCEQWLKSFREQRRMRLGATILAGARSPALAQSIFRIVEPTGMCEYLLAVLDELLLQARQRNERAQVVESEFLFRWYTLLNRLREMMPVIGEDVSFDTFWRLLSGIASQVKIPFSGEPLRGLQIMGMLESRLLDFDQVIMLSVNEDILPSAAGRVSFIPYGIRKAFGLPGPEEHQAVSAYHFFRLLQRASGVTLLHNSESG